MINEKNLNGEIKEKGKTSNTKGETKEKKFTPVYFAGPINGIVWDRENNRPLCKFVNGRYKAKNEREVKLLREWLAAKEHENVEAEKRAKEIYDKNSEEQIWAQNHS